MPARIRELRVGSKDQAGRLSEMERIRVLHIYETLGVGGGEKLLLSMLRRIDRQHFDTIACCLAARGPLGSEVEALGGRAIALNRLKNKHDWGVVFDLARLIRRERTDIVHVHLYNRASAYGRIAALLAKVPVIVATEHSLVTNRSCRERIAFRLLARHTDRIIANSVATRDYSSSSQHVNPDKYAVIYNGVEPSDFDVHETKPELREALSFAGYGQLVISVGRLVEVKGHRHLLEAVPLVLKQHPATGFLIVGDGPLEQDLKDQAQRLGIGRNIIFLGARSDVPKLLKAAELYVLSSLMEGFGLTIVEAMMSGLPVVATKVGGVPEIADEGRASILVPPRDPQSLAAAISRLLTDDERRRQMGQVGRAHALAHFTARRYVSDVEELYLSLLTKKSIRYS